MAHAQLMQPIDDGRADCCVVLHRPALRLIWTLMIGVSFQETTPQATRQAETERSPVEPAMGLTFVNRRRISTA
jgi:hypothetical protein